MMNLSLQAKQYGVSNETKQRVDEYYNGLNESLDTFTDIFKVDATISQSASFKERMEKEFRREIAEWQRKKEEEHRKRPDGEVVDPDPVRTNCSKTNGKSISTCSCEYISNRRRSRSVYHTLSNKLKQIIKSNKQIEFIE